MPRAESRSIDFIVEEPSAEVALEGLLPGLLPDGVSWRIINMQCKSKLLALLPQRLAGYSNMLKAGMDKRVVILIDRDDEDCKKLKKQLEKIAKDAGLATKKHPLKGRWQVVTRIACEELEAWFLGDPEAICQAYPKIPAGYITGQKYRAPDEIKGGTWEAAEHLLQKHGYFKGGLGKISFAQTVSPLLDESRSHSPSFKAFCVAARAACT